jgi:quercetin dioxygenase-like cupin family protein
MLGGETGQMTTASTTLHRDSASSGQRSIGTTLHRDNAPSGQRSIELRNKVADRPQAVGTKQIDNDRVVVTEWRFAPGAETGWHRHGYDYVVVPLLDGKLQIEDGKETKISELKAGRSYTRPTGVEHNVINANDFEYAFVEIELKPA